MRTRDMNRSEWTEITEKKQIIRNFTSDGKAGKISLMKILDISEPFAVNRGGITTVLLDRNYTWLQAALESEYIWLTAMFDEHDRFLQLYADLTDGNHMDSDNPCFEDMYLDFVIGEKDFIELDRDELDQAYADHLITEAQYLRTLNEAERFRQRFLRDPETHIKSLCSYQQKLKKELEVIV